MRKSFPKKRFPQIDFLLKQSPFTFYIFQIEIYGGNLSEEIEYSNPQKITCIIFENLFGPYFFPHQSHGYGYALSSGENLTSKISFKSDATYYFHIIKN